MRMKVVAALVLLAWFTVPLLFAAWMIFPLTAGIAAWLLYRFSGQPFVRRFLKPLLLVLLLAFVLWLLWIPKLTVPATSYASGTVHAIIKKAFGGVRSTPGSDASVVRERQEFASAIARARQKTSAIRTALILHGNGDAVSVHRNSRGLDDQAGLRPALETLRATLEPQPLEGGTRTPNLLDPKELDALVAAVRSALDGHEKKAEPPETTAQDIRALRLGILGLTAPFRVDSLYAAVSSVESALRNTLKVEVPVESHYYARYDRSSDQFTAEQQVIMHINNLQAHSIDLCGFLPRPSAPHVAGELQLSLDGLQERTVGSDECELDVRAAKQQLVIIKRSKMSHASRPILTDRFWMPFRAISVDWPLPLHSSALLTLGFPDDPTLTWPLTVPVETPLSAALDYVSIPRNSFYFATPAMKPNDVGDTLVPESYTPKINALAAGERITIELLPRYLSNGTGQKYKEYVAAENLVAALVVMIVTAVIAATVSSKP